MELARKGHVVARDEVQLCSLCVQYLSHDISAAGKTNSTTEPLLFTMFLFLKQNNHPLREGFVGLAGYYRV